MLAPDEAVTVVGVVSRADDDNQTLVHGGVGRLLAVSGYGLASRLGVR